MTCAELLKTAKPILFSTEMVRAILDGKKTQTRRVIKPQPADDFHRVSWNVKGKDIVAYKSSLNHKYGNTTTHFPKYQPGDVLYVQETFCVDQLRILFDPKIKETSKRYIYKESHGDYPISQQGDILTLPKWKPSIHMPKKAARIFLQVTGVRAERLQDISQQDCAAEGITDKFNRPKCTYPWCDYLVCNKIRRYSDLWNSLYSKKGYGWDINPFVWVYEFERVEVETQ